MRLAAESFDLDIETYNDVYEENQENQKLLRHEADHDDLTKAFNRGAFNRLLQLYESGNTDYALIIIDADNFKSINDTYGHAAGDMVLQRIADVVKKEFRSMDYICRIGGDEFTVIMVEVSRKHRDIIARKLTSINKELSFAKENTPAISLSMGVALITTIHCDFSNSSLINWTLLFRPIRS